MATILATATGTCEIEAQAAGGTDLPRVSMLGYTGVPMRLAEFRLPIVVDLESLKVPRQKVPILRAHDAGRIAGHTEKIDVSAQQLTATGVLSGVDKHVTDVIHTARNGFPWQTSMGAQTDGPQQHVSAGETAKVNGRVWQGPLLVARNAILRELSLLPMGADGNTEAALAARAVVERPPAVEEPADPSGPWSFVGMAYGGRPVLADWFPQPIVVDLMTLVFRAPVLLCLNHDLRRPVGMAEKVWREGGNLLLKGEIFPDHDFPAADLVADAVANGARWQLSLGIKYAADLWEIEYATSKRPLFINGRHVPPQTPVFRFGQLTEISFVEVGADPDAIALFRGATPS